jgi:hypothetical protein
MERYRDYWPKCDGDACIMEAFLKAGALAVIAKDGLDELPDTIRRACSKQVMQKRET